MVDSADSNIFENGQPDARQVGDIKPTRFRPRYRQLSPTEISHHDKIKDAASALDALFEQINPSREISLAMTKLEEAVMWAVKGLTK